MAEIEEQRNESESEPIRIELVMRPGYELVEYTLMRLCDGHLETYQAEYSNEDPTLTVPPGTYIAEDTSDTAPPNLPITTSSSDSQIQEDFQSSYNHTSPGLLTPTRSYEIPIREKRKKSGQLNSSAQGLSAKTNERYANSRKDGYTIVCGVKSAEIVPPVKKLNYGNGKYRCPRCKSNFTREKTVKDHFPDCISKHGNPEGLSFTDHPSMKRERARIQSINGASGHVSSSRNVREDEEMSDAQSGSLTPTGAPIKTEFVYGADVPMTSIERMNSIERGLTPAWQTARNVPSREGSSLPTPNPYQWDIDIPGSAAEHDTMDSRFTAPLNLRPSESQTPRPTSGDGLQADGLDDFMDRRSHIDRTPTVCPSPDYDDRTPTACPSPNYDDYLHEDVKMEEEASV